MKKKDKFIKYILIIVVLLFGSAFIVKFGGPALLKFYVRSGIGDCQKIPILCKMPTEKIINPVINKDFIEELLPHSLAKIEIKIPEGFTVIQEKVKKVYYKKRKREHHDAVVYLFYQESNFFTNLFPQLKNKGIQNDYEFIKRVMHANFEGIKDVTDAFFVIMKGIFIPDLGSQQDIKMIELASNDKMVFINYNFSATGNYFDCNIVNQRGDFFKIYIRDKDKKLDLEKVFAIISTVDSVKSGAKLP